MRGSALALAGHCVLSSPSFAQDSSSAFDIPSEPLAKALHDYAAAARQQIIFLDGDVAGKTAPPLKGNYPPDRALDILLAGTGLAVDRSSSAGIMVRARTKTARANRDDETIGLPGESVTVTGTRVMRAGFETPAPTLILSIDDMARSGNSNLADTLNDLPEINGGLGASVASASGNYIGQTYASLRGLGESRTLTLVDGQRFTPTSIYDGVSISIIPQALVQRVEVVTGGASAQWGSDAIAGVVNFILDHDVEGIRGSLQGGTTDRGDYQNYLVSFAAGHRFANGRAYVELSGEAGDNNGVPAMSRDWLRVGWQTITNPGVTAATATPSNPQTLTLPNVRTANASYGGVITSGPLMGTQFGPGGVPTIFNYGSYLSGSTMIGGDGVLRDDMAKIAAPIKRQAGYGLFSYDMTPRLEVYAEVFYGHTLTVAPLTLPGSAPDTAINISIDNAFLPASIVAAMKTDGISGFTMGRWSSDYAMNIIHYDVETLRASGGFKGSFGAGWSWDINYYYGGTNNPIKTLNNRNTAHYNLAIDAVTDPATGAAVCRSALADPGNGCVPLDLFGPNAPSRSALNYVMGTSWKDYDVRQANAAATLNGTPFSTWAGPVSFATGVEYRHENINVTADPVAEAGNWGVSSQVPFLGGVTVWEGFGEFVAPLAKGESWAKEINLDIAIRETGYSTSGTITTWKAGLSYAVNDSIRLRADRSHDFRAPRLTDLYQGGSSANSTVIDRLTNTSVYVYTPSAGNPALRPETADTTTAGFILTPDFLPDFMASVDFWDIQLKGLITGNTSQEIVDNCYHYDIGCDLITRVNGVITKVVSTETNLQSGRANGLDLEAEYRIPDGEFGWNDGLGDVSLHFTGAWLGLMTITQLGAAAPMNYAGRLVYGTTPSGFSGGPRWRFTLRAAWDDGPYDFSVTGRYVGGGDNYTAPDMTDSYNNLLKASNRLYTDLDVQYRLKDKALGSPAFFLGVRNLFDLAPPITGGTNLGAPPTDVDAYDVIGRQYMAGIRFSY